MLEYTLLQNLKIKPRSVPGLKTLPTEEILRHVAPYYDTLKLMKALKTNLLEHLVGFLSRPKQEFLYDLSLSVHYFKEIFSLH